MFQSILSIVPQSLQVYGVIILAEVIFGVWPVVASMAIREGFDPFVFVFYRCAGSATLLMAMSFLIEGQSTWNVLMPLKHGKVMEAARHFPWQQFLLLGALMCTNFLGYIIGVACTTSTQASLMQPLAPVLACLAGVASGTESVSNGKLVGIFLSVTGAMYLVYMGHEEADDHGKRAGKRYMLGTLALVVNVTSTAFYFVLQKTLLRRFKPIFVTSVTMVVATCYMMFVVFFYAQEFKYATWRPWILTPRREAALAYAIIFTTTCNFCLLGWANKVTTPSTILAFSTLQPLFAAVTALLCLGIVPHRHTIGGGIAILGGLLLTARAQLGDAQPSTIERCSEDSNLL